MRRRRGVTGRRHHLWSLPPLDSHGRYASRSQRRAPLIHSRRFYKIVIDIINNAVDEDFCVDCAGGKAGFTRGSIVPNSPLGEAVPAVGILETSRFLT